MATGPPQPANELPRLLAAWREGDDAALEQLFPLVYKELRRLAASKLADERGDHTLQPTALVHEAFLRLLDQQQPQVANRAHFLALAAMAMRRILVDHARRAKAGKRPAPELRSSLEDLNDGAAESLTPTDPDILDLHGALERLAQIRPRSAQVVELRYFGGLTYEETALYLDISTTTVERDWEMARAWLYQRLGHHLPADGERP